MSANRNGLTGLDLAVAEEVRAELARRRRPTLSEISEVLGIRRATLSARINGHVAFSPSLLEAVCRLIGLSASELVARAERRLLAVSA